MRVAKFKIGVLALAVFTLGMMSCKDAKKKSSNEKVSEISPEKSIGRDSNGVELIIDNYMELKDALVGDNQELAAKAGKKLASTLSSFDTKTLEVANETEVKSILASAKESADQIGKSKITQQREHFEGLSDNLVSLVAITGAPMPLYQQFCPMYKDDKGGMWVSTVKAVKNPYFGSQMLNCGFVQKELN
ncbi:DUF3347 domain-containing protein [Arenibacter certesii]|uniref:DUF3347 domain-containing protein n=1 Tax=Arenibacter certesii TaxID=228955 RepID=A0A918IP65_9FLAO|nr:DUF3347 domain-containing protein [Arenibacter certesii]GGW24551.1 hypothetical protein GCM10007383_06370 [Arenibacter certesii]